MTLADRAQQRPIFVGNHHLGGPQRSTSSNYFLRIGHAVLEHEVNAAKLSPVPLPTVLAPNGTISLLFTRRLVLRCEQPIKSGVEPPALIVGLVSTR